MTTTKHWDKKPRGQNGAINADGRPMPGAPDSPDQDDVPPQSFSTGGAIDEGDTDPALGSGQDETSDHVNAAMEAVHEAFQYGRKLHGLPTEEEQGAIPGQQADNGASGASATQSQAGDNSEAAWRGGVKQRPQPSRPPILDMTPRPLPIAPTFGKRADAGAMSPGNYASGGGIDATYGQRAYDAQATNDATGNAYLSGQGGPAPLTTSPNDFMGLSGGGIDSTYGQRAYDATRENDAMGNAYLSGQQSGTPSFAPGGPVGEDDNTPADPNPDPSSSGTQANFPPTDDSAGAINMGPYDAPEEKPVYQRAGEALGRVGQAVKRGLGNLATPGEGMDADPMGYLAGKGAASNATLEAYKGQARELMKNNGSDVEGSLSALAVGQAKTPQDRWAAVQNLNKNYTHNSFLSKASLNGANGKDPDPDAAVHYANNAEQAFPDGNKTTWSRTEDGKFLATVKFPGGGGITKDKPEASYTLTPEQFNEYQDQGKNPFHIMYENGVIKTLDRISKGAGTPLKAPAPSDKSEDTEKRFYPTKEAMDAHRRYPWISQEGQRQDLQREMENTNLDRKNKVDVAAGVQKGKVDVAEATGKSREASATIKGQSNENVQQARGQSNEAVQASRASEMSKRTEMNLQSREATAQDQMDYKLNENYNTNAINGVAKPQEVQDAQDRIIAKHLQASGGGQGAPAAAPSLGQRGQGGAQQRTGAQTSKIITNPSTGTQFTQGPDGKLVPVPSPK